MALGKATSSGAEMVLVCSLGARSMSSWWPCVEPADKDPILWATEAFLADPNPSKVNGCLGAYRDDNGKQVVLECVSKAERRIAGSANMEHLPMGASVKMAEETLKLAGGDRSEFVRDRRIAAVQSLLVTGGRRINLPTWTKSKGLDVAALMDEVKLRTVRSFYSMRALNPAGVNPSEDEWKEFSYQLKVKGYLLFFDMAYQGLASGDPSD